MAHHYHDFFMTYDHPREEKQEKQTSGSIGQEKTGNNKQNKEAKCSDMTK